MKIPIDQIIVTDRFRKDFGDLENLATSISDHGLIQPIIVTENNQLIAGERRLRACQLAGLKEVEIRTISDLSEIEQREIELEENLHRKEFEWVEEVKAKAEIHRLKQDKYGKAIKGHESEGWGIEKTAQAIDESVGNVHMDIKLAEALEKYPDLAKEKNKSRARKRLKQLQEKEVLEELASRIGDEGNLDAITFKKGDCREVMQSLPDNSIDLVITDPPWGIDFDTLSAFSRTSEVAYEDEKVASFKLLDEALVEIHRVMKNSTHMYLFFGITMYAETIYLLEEAGFDVNPIPLIWNKGSGGAPARGKTHPVAYEVAFHCTKGRKDLKTGTSNMFTYPRPSVEEKVHDAQKPIELIQEWIENSSDPEDIILDPFAGSGVTGVAAALCGREAILIEQSDRNYSAMTEFAKTTLIKDVMDNE